MAPHPGPLRTAYCSIKPLHFCRFHPPISPRVSARLCSNRHLSNGAGLSKIVQLQIPQEISEGENVAAPGTSSCRLCVAFNTACAESPPVQKITSRSLSTTSFRSAGVNVRQMSDMMSVWTWSSISIYVHSELDITRHPVPVGSDRLDFGAIHRKLNIRG